MTSTATAVEMNGVNTPGLFATINAVREQPDVAAFRFRATNRWLSGTHNRSTISGFFGAGSEQAAMTSSPSTPITRRCSSARIRARPRWSTCCTRSPPA